MMPTAPGHETPFSAAAGGTSPRAYRLPNFIRLRLGGGLRVVLAEDHTTPLVQLHAALPAGVRSELGGREGLAALTMAALKEGTARRNAAQINDAAEELGADILTHADWDMSAAVVELLSSDLAAGAELLFEMLASPSFPEAAVEGLRRRQLLRLGRQSSVPAEIADQWFARALYGGGPYGRPLLGLRSSLQKLGRERLVEFHGAHFGLPGMVVVAVGSFRAERLARILESNSGRCSRAAAPEPPATETASPAKARTLLLDLPGASQTELRVGHLGVARGHPEFASLQLLSAVLGRRLKRRLREERGHTYHLRCRFVSRSCAGPFAVTAGVGNEHVGGAVREIAGEMERLCREPVTGEELDAARNYLTGVYLRAFQPGHEFVTQLKLLAAHGLPDDHFEGYLRGMAEADAGRLLRLARQHFYPQGLVVVAAGPAALLRPQLAECPALTLIDADGVCAPFE